MKARPQREAIEATIKRLGGTGGGQALTACLTALDIIEEEAWPLDRGNRQAVLLAVMEALKIMPPPSAEEIAAREAMLQRALAKAPAAREAGDEQR